MTKRPLLKRARIYRSIGAGVFIIILFEVGIWAYLKTRHPIVSQVQTKNFRAAIQEHAAQVFQIKIASSGQTEKLITIPPKELKTFLEEYTRDFSGEKDLRINTAKVEDYLTAIAPNINREPINARFTFHDNRADIFVAAVPGRKLDVQESAAAIQKGLISGDSPVSLILDAVEPEITLEKINNLGINTLLATGTSDFVGSSPSRILNIKIASAKYNGLILKPDEEFSFNNILGEVEASGGYAAEKVIKSNKLVYEYGGGICQVSTTLFRAAILAGFPILERRPHAFPVQYYNPQGFDATIYPGITDLRFKNDSGGYAILQTNIVGTKISFQIYGSHPDRTVKMGGPVQYDQKPDGSMKAYFTRSITYVDGKNKEERFNSTYRSPALYPLEKNPLE